MKKYVLTTLTLAFSFQTSANEQPLPVPNKVTIENVENYYESINFDRNNECVSDNKIYSVGMRIKKEDTLYICNKFELGRSNSTSLDKEAPASWRIFNNNH